MDAFGPMRTDVHTGHSYALVAVCSLTRFVFLQSYPDTSADSAARFLIQIGGIFGWPRALRYDNSSQFSNHLISALLSWAGIEKRPSIPFCPQSNGIAERSIKEVLRHLRCLCNVGRDHDDWTIMLPFVMRIMNAEPQAGIGVSPSRMLMPASNLDRGLFPETGGGSVQVEEGLLSIHSRKRKEEIQNWVSHLRALQAQMIRSHGEYSETVKHRNLEKEPIDLREFPDDSWVVTSWLNGKPHKLAMQKKGPFQVKRKLSAHLYEVQDPADLRKYKMSARHLEAYNMKQDEDPRDVIAMDEAEVLVDKILDHTTRNSNKRTDFDFLVRWKDQRSEEDMWVPYSEVRPLAAFDEYVRQHPELRRFGIFPDDSEKPKAAKRPRKQK